MRVEKGFVVEFEHGQIDANGDRLDRRGDFVARLVGLNLHLTGVFDDVGVGQNAFALDDDATTGDSSGLTLGPRLEHVRIADSGENFDDGICHGIEIGIRAGGHGRFEGGFGCCGCGFSRVGAVSGVQVAQRQQRARGDDSPKQHET